MKTLMILILTAFSSAHAQSTCDFSAPKFCQLQPSAIVQHISSCVEAGESEFSLLSRMVMHSVYHANLKCLDRLEQTGLLSTKILNAQARVELEDLKNAPYSIPSLDISRGPFSPLAHASFLENILVMDKLIALGADSKKTFRVDYGQLINAVGTAALYGKVKSIDYLKSKGASLSSTDNEIPPLIMSIFGQSTSALDYLIHSGVDLNQKSRSEIVWMNLFRPDDTALVTAMKLHRNLRAQKFTEEAIIKLLKNSANPYLGEGLLTTFVKATVFDEKFFSEIIASGVDINQSSEYPSELPIQSAAGSHRTIKVMIEKFGAKVNHPVPNMQQAHIGFIYVWAWGNRHSLEFLINEGLDVHQTARCKIEELAGGEVLTSIVCDNQFPATTMLELAEQNLKAYQNGADHKGQIQRLTEIIQFLKTL